ncbi:MAG: glutamine amidotransferase, partial [Vicinamibacterales bacterium]
EGVHDTSISALEASGRATDLSGAVAAVAERFRGRRVAGVLVLSDGADTGGGVKPAATTAPAPIFTVGVGSPTGIPDREVVAMASGDPRIDEAAVDLHVTVAQHGLGAAPFTLRLLANGKPIETRQVTPGADGTPSHLTFSVLPDPLNATLYTADIPTGPAEAVTENNSRSVLLNPADRKRRVLALSGAPGYEHAFLARALVRDSGLEVDSVVRKGKDERGADTFLIQATGGRGAMLTKGFPSTREALFAYDAVLIGNVEADFFGKAQLQLLADFVSLRGGGILLMGGRSFQQRGMSGSPLEQVLPLDLGDRRGAAPPRASDGEGMPPSGVALTNAGLSHPITRVAPTQDETTKAWAALPPLASVAPVGGPRPGATVLAVASSPASGTVPLVAVQRYGRGRSMVFAGEASWRWRMQRPSTDQTFEHFWRQATRWLAGEQSDPVQLTVPESSAVGESIDVRLETRNAAFEPVGDAVVEAALTGPDGTARPIAMRPVAVGQQAATIAVDTPGLHRLHAEARRGEKLLGASDRWFQVGGYDPEFADPRLNEAVLKRLAQRSGGRYVPAADVDRVLRALSAVEPGPIERERRDLWHGPWPFLFIVLLLSGEWVLRRRWGLR